MKIWDRIFSDNLFEGIRPDKAQRKTFYDRCFRRCERQFKKEGQKPTKEEMNEAIHDCLTAQVYEFQFHNEKARKYVGTDFETGTIDRQKEEQEFAEDVRRLNRINRDFFSTDSEDAERERTEQNKKLKDWIEDKIQGESNYA